MDKERIRRLINFDDGNVSTGFNSISGFEDYDRDLEFLYRVVTYENKDLEEKYGKNPFRSQPITNYTGKIFGYTDDVPGIYEDNYKFSDFTKSFLIAHREELTGLRDEYVTLRPYQKPLSPWQSEAVEIENIDLDGENGFKNEFIDRYNEMFSTPNQRDELYEEWKSGADAREWKNILLDSAYDIAESQGYTDWEEIQRQASLIADEEWGIEYEAPYRKFIESAAVYMKHIIEKYG